MKPTLDEELMLENDEAWHAAFAGCFDKNPSKGRAQCNAFREKQRLEFKRWPQEDFRRRLVEVIKHFRDYKEYPATTIPDFVDDHRTIEQVLTPSGSEIVQIENEPVACLQYDQLLVAESLNDDFVEGYKNLAQRDDAIRNRLLAFRQGGPNGDFTIRFIPSTTRTYTASDIVEKTITIHLAPRSMCVFGEVRVPFIVSVDHEGEHGLGRLYDDPLSLARQGTPDSQFGKHEERHAIKREAASLIAMNKPIRNYHWGFAISSRGVASFEAALKVAVEEEPFEMLTEYKSTGHIYEIREKKNELVILTKSGQRKFVLSEITALIILANFPKKGFTAADWGFSGSLTEHRRALIRDAYNNGDSLVVTLEKDGIKLPTIGNEQQAIRKRGASDTSVPGDDELRQAYEDLLLNGFAQLPSDMKEGKTHSECFKYITYDSFKKDMLEAHQYGDEYLTRFKEEYLIAQQFRLYATIRERDDDWDWSWDSGIDEILYKEQCKELTEEVQYESELVLAVDALAKDPRPALQISDMSAELSKKLMLIASFLEKPKPDKTQILAKIDKAMGDENESREKMLKELLESQSDLTETMVLDTDNELVEICNTVNEIQAAFAEAGPLSSELWGKLKEPIQRLDKYKREQCEWPQEVLYYWLMREIYRRQRELPAAVSREIVFVESRMNDESSRQQLEPRLGQLRSMHEEASQESSKPISAEKTSAEHLDSLQQLIAIKEKMQPFIIDRLSETLEEECLNCIKPEVFRAFLEAKTFQQLSAHDGLHARGSAKLMNELNANGELGAYLNNFTDGQVFTERAIERIRFRKTAQRQDNGERKIVHSHLNKLAPGDKAFFLIRTEGLSPPAVLDLVHEVAPTDEKQVKTWREHYLLERVKGVNNESNLPLSLFPQSTERRDVSISLRTFFKEMDSQVLLAWQRKTDNELLAAIVQTVNQRQTQREQRQARPIRKSGR